MRLEVGKVKWELKFSMFFTWANIYFIREREREKKGGERRGREKRREKGGTKNGKKERNEEGREPGRKKESLWK